MRSPLFALTQKELRKFFTSAIYMLNAGIGLIFTLAISALAITKREMISQLALVLFGNPDSAAPVLAIALAVLSSMNMMSASALSLEGKSFWILKTIPVSDNVAIFSKALPQIVVSIPPVLISSVLMIIASGASFAYWIFIILTPIVVNVFFAFLGVIFNILAPKFEFDNDAQPIKQSLAVLLTMLTQMLVSALVALLTYFLLIRGYVLLSALAGLLIFTLLAIASYFVLFIPCKQKYAKM